MNDFSTVLPNELALVAQATVDSAAFASIYDHYFSRVYNYIRYRVQDTDVTDDITAQVFERALSHIGSYRQDKAPFSAWLFAIARNAVNDYLRSQKRWRWLSLDVLWNWSSSEPQPAEVVAKNELQDKLLSAVARLGSRERDLIGLKFAAGLTNRRIAELTGLNENNVSIILYRAVRRLRAELEAEGVER
jgi:RNA polymerase sigma-70 factor (ECF subfamily)